MATTKALDAKYGVSINGSGFVDASKNITSGTVNKVTITAPANGSTLTIADGKTLTVSNTLTFTGTDASSVAFGTGGTAAYTENKLSAFAATTSSELAGVISDETGTGLLVFATSPAFTTSVTTGSTSFDVFNTTATTVNAFGAATALTIGATSGSTTVRNDLTVTGNLTVNGSTVTVNSTVTTLDDPIITLGGDTAPTSDDAKDRGVEFRWHNGSSAKLGFFGFDRSTERFTFIPDATNTSEVFGGTSGDIEAKDAYLSNLYLYDDTNPSHYLGITNSGDLTGAKTLSVNVNDADRTISLSGNLTIANNFTTSGNFALTLTTTGATNVTLPTSGTLATTGDLSQFAATTSAELAGIISDETGTGVLVFATSPSFTTSVTTGSTSFDVFNTTATTVNAFGAATALRLANTGTSARTIDIATNATGGASTVNFGGAVSGNTLKINSTASGSVTLSSDVTTGIVNLFTGATGTVNIGAAESNIYFGTQTAVSGSTTTVATVSQTATDTFSVTAFRSCEYHVQITQGSAYQMSKVLLVHDGTTAYITEYGTVASGTILGTLDADISGGNVRLLVTMGSANSASVKVSRKTIAV